MQKRKFTVGYYLEQFEAAERQPTPEAAELARLEIIRTMFAELRAEREARIAAQDQPDQQPS